jgi:hypothetical protein
MASSKPYIFEIIMFTAGPNAFLHRGRSGISAGFFAQKEIFKLHHPGRRKE